MSQLNDTYKKEIRPKLQKEFSIKNEMAIPKLKKIVINVGLGEALTNKKALETTSSQIQTITGQKPVITHARHDISTFKLRRGDAVGVKVTLRAGKMYDFLEKFVRIVLPRIRDFRGIPTTGFDSHGNYTLGLAEQIVFPEIEFGQVDRVRGLEITFVTTSTSDQMTKRFLELLGMPFKKG